MAPHWVEEPLRDVGIKRAKACPTDYCFTDYSFPIHSPALNDMAIGWIRSFGIWAPGLCLALFLAGSFLMLWRLESMSAAGVEGTVLGTLVMPYCSGL